MCLHGECIHTRAHVLLCVCKSLRSAACMSSSPQLQLEMNTAERGGDYQRVHRGIRTIKSCYAAPQYTAVGGNCTKRTYNPHFLFMTFLPDTNSEGGTNSLFVKGTDQYHSFLVFPLPTAMSPCSASTTVTLCKPKVITRTTIITVYCNNYQQWRHHCCSRCYLASLTPAEAIYSDRFPLPLIIFPSLPRPLLAPSSSSSPQLRKKKNHIEYQDRHKLRSQRYKLQPTSYNLWLSLTHKGKLAASS